MNLGGHNQAYNILEDQHPIERDHKWKSSRNLLQPVRRYPVDTQNCSLQGQELLELTRSPGDPEHVWLWPLPGKLTPILATSNLVCSSTFFVNFSCVRSISALPVDSAPRGQGKWRPGLQRAALHSADSGRPHSAPYLLELGQPLVKVPDPYTQ